MPIIEVPGQGLVEFPDSMSDDEIGKAISRSRMASKPIKPAPYGAGSEMLSGLTFGFGDELRSQITGEPLEAIRAGQKAYRTESPVASTVANIAGSLPTMFIPGAGLATAARGIGMAGKAARAVGTVGTGAAYGGLSGAGEATDDKAGGAASGAAFGAVLSPAGAAVGRGVQAIGQRRMTTLPADLQAQKILLGKLQAGGIDPAKATVPQGQTIAELSKPTESLAGSVIRRSPEAAQRAASLASQRKSQRGPALLQAVQGEVTQGVAPTSNQIEKATAAQRRLADPYYKQAYSEAAPISIPPSLLERPSVQRAMGVLNQMAKERGMPEFQPGSQLTLEGADLLKRAMDDVIYNGKMPTSGIGPQMLRDMQETRALYMQAVDSQAPESYRLARTIYSSGARNQEAADLGADAWKRGPEYVADFMQTASESEKQAFRAAANAKLNEMAGNIGGGREVFRSLMDKPNMQAVAQQLSQVQGPSAIPALVRRQKAEADFEQRLIGGSQTAERRAADEALDTESLPVQIAQQGLVGGLLSSAGQAIVDRARTGGNRVVNELDRLLLDPEMTANMETLRRLNLLQDQLRREAGIRAGSYGAGAAGTGAQAGGLFGGSQ